MTANADWLHRREDPFRQQLLSAGPAMAERVRESAEPLVGEPAFDPIEIASAAEALVLPDDAAFEHPLLEQAVRIGLAHIDATFDGDHPKYGRGVYAGPEHDAFPPTIIAVVDALTQWGAVDRACALFAYWLDHFVREDGTIDYYAPSLSEYGKLLTTARRIVERGGGESWLAANHGSVDRLVHYVQSVIRTDDRICLARGVPEADEAARTATYFHNNAWLVRGLADWAIGRSSVCGEDSTVAVLRHDASALRQILLESVQEAWPLSAGDTWLRPTVEAEGVEAPPDGVTSSRIGSYTNYRYWPELLGSGVLPRSVMRRIVRARHTQGGQFLGMTRFDDHLDDWPLMDYLDGLWQLGLVNDYRYSLWGHIGFHQAPGHLTAYEQVGLPPGRPLADYCLPAQLVAARAARRLRPDGHAWNLSLGAE